MYLYILVHTGSYWYIRVHTSTYQFIPMLIKVQKKCKRALNPRSSAYCSHAFPLHCKSTDTKYRIWNMEMIVLYNDCAHSCLCIWLLTSDRRRRSRSAPASGHDVHRPDLDWNLRLTIASPCLSQSAGFNRCRPDAAFKMQVALSLAVPVPVPRPGAHWWLSQCVGPAFQ